MLRVQAAMDRATVKELHLCLTNEHQGKSLKFFQLNVMSKNNYLFFLKRFCFFGWSIFCPYLNYLCAVLFSTMFTKDFVTGTNN